MQCARELESACAEHSGARCEDADIDAAMTSSIRSLSDPELPISSWSQPDFGASSLCARGTPLSLMCPPPPSLLELPRAFRAALDPPPPPPPNVSARSRLFDLLIALGRSADVEHTDLELAVLLASNEPPPAAPATGGGVISGGPQRCSFGFGLRGGESLPSSLSIRSRRTSPHRRATSAPTMTMIADPGDGGADDDDGARAISVRAISA